MSDEIRNQVEDPHAHRDIKTATSLSEAADSGHSIQGYASVNGLSDDSEIAVLAYEFYQQRETEGSTGSADSDWLRAETEIRRRRVGSLISGIAVSSEN